MLIIPNRPFSTDAITGLMLPDGIFDATLGKQRINAHFTNQGAAPSAPAAIYVESISHPGIVVTAATHATPALPGNASRVLSWDADFSSASEGVHYVSFIAESGPTRNRIIKKIFVTRVVFDPASTSFSAKTPEGVLSVTFRELVVPQDLMCCGRGRRQDPNAKEVAALINYVGQLFSGHQPDFKFCPPGYLPLEFEASVTPTPPYSGQYGDLPFEDPWWKIVLCIIAVILLIAASIVAATSGSGSVTVTTDGGGTGGDDSDCCGVGASGGSDSYVVAGLVAAAAAAATAAGMSDTRDPFRRGQDATPPGDGETTLSESVVARFKYPEPVVTGKAFSVALDWKYARTTDAKVYTFGAADVGQNIHTLSNYVISAPEVGYRHAPWIVTGEFLDSDGKRLIGDQLLVQCFVAGPNGEYRKFTLQDDGLDPDAKANDGVYTGQFYFRGEKGAPGLWRYFVIAQDVNNAQPDMSPEEAAQIIGGMVLTSQLVITFDQDECPFVPDGFVNVI